MTARLVWTREDYGEAQTSASSLAPGMAGGTHTGFRFRRVCPAIPARSGSGSGEIWIWIRGGLDKKGEKECVPPKKPLKRPHKGKRKGHKPPHHHPPRHNRPEVPYLRC